MRFELILTRSILLLAMLATASAASADTVRMKDGKVLKGRVLDRGTYVILEHPDDLGAVRIERAEIATIEVEGEPARPPRDVDVVILTTDVEVVGQVEVRESGRTIAVMVEGKGEITFDHRQVREIRWSTRATEKQRAGTPEGVGVTVERLVETLGSADEEARKKARDDLFRMSLFALPYLEARAAAASPPLKGVLDDVITAAKVRTSLSPGTAELVAGIERRLIHTEKEVRLAAAQELVATSPRDSVPILVLLLDRERDPVIRAFLVGQLAKLGRIEELLQIVERGKDGSLRLAAAIALGDNGVHVGLPLVIEALKIDDLAIRKLAISKLEAWTGQFLGFFPDDEPAKREAAVARWEAWWAESGKRYAEDSLRGTIKKDFTEDERTEATAHWKAAHQIWTDAVERKLEGDARKDQLEKSWLYFRKSLSILPTFVSARISMAVLLYMELGQPEEAKRELELVLTRFAGEGGKLSKQQAHFHLARIAHLAKEWSEAERHYRQALPDGGPRFDALLGLARCLYDRAVTDTALRVERRKELLEQAIDQLDAALADVDAYEHEVDASTKEGAVEELADVRPFKGGAFLASVDQARLELKRTAAEIHFMKGRAFAALKADDAARKSYSAAIELDPENALYRRALAAWK